MGKGSRPIYNWHIPKLELLQSVIPNIRANGATIQFSADVTEHAHITEIKDPARVGNNQRYELQICRDLDHTDKMRRFDLATAIRDPENLIPSDYNTVSDISVDDMDKVPAPIPLARLARGSI